VHLNPNVQQMVQQELAGIQRIHLIHPLGYREFLVLMEHAFMILTDSGGIQEEAPSFRKPVLIMREVSERGEGIRLGIAKLVGTSVAKIKKEAARILENPKVYRAMTGKKNPYGDGHASERIFRITQKLLRRA
jgi:UDP-N-acetylglucosamine 2-epimerase (non-hydrolysing)